MYSDDNIIILIKFVLKNINKKNYFYDKKL